MLELFAHLDQRVFFVFIALFIGGISSYMSGKLGKSLWSPFWQFFQNITLFFNTRLNKPSLKRGNLVFRGFLSLAIVLFITELLGWLFTYINLIYNFNNIIELIVLILFLSPLSSLGANTSVRQSIKSKKSLNGIYYCLARDSQIDLNSLDDYGMTRLAGLLSSIHFERAIVGIVLFYLAFGVWGILFYTAINAFFMSSGAMGHDKGFSKIGHLLAWVLNIIPNYLTAVLFIIAGAFTPSAQMRFGIKALFSGHGRAKWGEGGVSATVLAYMFGVTLGGPMKSLNGQSMKNVWVGHEEASAKLNEDHIRRITYLQVSAYALVLLGVLSLLLL